MIFLNKSVNNVQAVRNMMYQGRYQSC